VDVRLPGRPARISESCLSQPAWTTTPKITEQILIVRGKAEAEVTNKKRLLLELNRDKYEATRGLSATAELLDLISYAHRLCFIFFCHYFSFLKVH